MLTKILKVEDDVLFIIKTMRWENDGLLGVITGVTDRKLYERTNKALMAMGGKWNRKAGGHVFEHDPRPHVEGLIDNGSLTVERDGFFETPPHIVEQMLQLADLRAGMTVLEPSAGKGAIARKMLDYGIELYVIEKNEQRAKWLFDQGYEVIGRDFLEFDFNKFDRIVMNPPFEEGQDITHIQHAHSLLKPGGTLVSIMSEGPFFRSDTRSKDFRQWLEDKDGETERLPANTFKESGTGVNSRIIVISR